MIIVDIEQGTAEWKKLRLAKVTGTRIKDVLGNDNLSLVDKIIAEMVSGQGAEVFINEAMQRGTDYEPLARAEYEKETGHKVEEFGFLLHSKYDWLGMSPDGLIKLDKKDKVYKKGIEIKCPNTATHVKYIRQNKVPNEYKYQVMAMFLINPALEEHDFVSFDNRFKLKPLHIVTTTRKDWEGLEVIEAELVDFWAKVLKYHDQVTF